MRKSILLYIVGSIIVGIAATLIIYFVLLGSGIIGDSDNNKLVIASKSSSVIYDGTELVCHEYEIVEGELDDDYECIEVDVDG